MKDQFVGHYAALLGKKVIRIVVDSGGGFPCYGLKFSDGTIAWILADPEGNGPGFLDIVEGKG